jgi:hypothetical protein
MSRKKLFGALAIEKGCATVEDVLECLKIQYRAKVVFGRHLFLGEVMVLQGILDEDALREILEESEEFFQEPEEGVSEPLFGEVAVSRGYVTPAQVLECLDTQVEDVARGDRYRLLGEIMYDRGYLSRAQIDEVIEILFKEKRMR